MRTMTPATLPTRLAVTPKFLLRNRLARMVPVMAAARAAPLPHRLMERAAGAVVAATRNPPWARENSMFNDYHPIVCRLLNVE